MGASTGNMLVDKYASLLHIFETASSIGLPIMVHCEDSETINANMDRMLSKEPSEAVAIYPKMDCVR